MRQSIAYDWLKSNNIFIGQELYQTFWTTLNFELINKLYLSDLYSNATNSTTKNVTQRIYCIQIMDDIIDAPIEVRHNLIIPFVTLGIIGALVNGLVVCLVYKTRQLTNQSTKLIFTLSIYDSLHSIVTNLGHSVYIGQSEILPCFVKQIIFLVNAFLVASQFTMIDVIAFDRLMRVVWVHTMQ